MNNRTADLALRCAALRQRRELIIDRLAELSAIRTALASQPNGRGSRQAREPVARESVKDSQLAASRAAGSSAAAFRQAAAAHDSAADAHERSSAAGIGVWSEHERMTVFHRAAAETDRSQADTADHHLQTPA
jgi:hypothetical protein